MSELQSEANDFVPGRFGGRNPHSDNDAFDSALTDFAMDTVLEISHVVLSHLLGTADTNVKEVRQSQACDATRTAGPASRSSATMDRCDTRFLKHEITGWLFRRSQNAKRLSVVDNGDDI